MSHHNGHNLRAADPDNTTQGQKYVAKGSRGSTTDDSLDELLYEYGNTYDDGDGLEYRAYPYGDLKAALEAWANRRTIQALEALSMAVIEPCEPECDAVRHARHEGTWQAHLVIDEEIERLQRDTEGGQDG